MSATTVTALLAQIADLGRDPVRGGYSRPGYSDVEQELRSWFVAAAQERGLGVQTDRNGIVWAWEGDPADGAVVTGSHLDSVPGGGAFDGPLGVASALVAFDLLRERQVPGARAIAVFPEEEGSRFGLACLGSRLLTGALDPARALRLTDPDGTTYAQALRRCGLDPERIGPDPQMLARIGTFVELHVEQGRGLIDLDRPVAVATSILGHGRWRITVHGKGNHAGSTLMADRSDPMVVAAAIVTDVDRVAGQVPGARATVGRLVPVPGGTNVIASRVDLWLDARHPDDARTRELVARIAELAAEAARRRGCTVEVSEESFSGTVDFDRDLAEELRTAVPGAPSLPSGAGHDAGVLQAHVRTGMLFVRNPTGVSHAPDEHVEDADAEAGAIALAAVLEPQLRS